MLRQDYALIKKRWLDRIRYAIIFVANIKLFRNFRNGSIQKGATKHFKVAFKTEREDYTKL